jgi:transcription termination factor Rho
VAAEALEQSALEGKDKDQLLQIAKALGVKGTSRLKKAEIIDRILDTTGVNTPLTNDTGSESTSTGSNGAADRDVALSDTTSPAAVSRERPAGGFSSNSNRAASSAQPAVETVGADGEPLADWEISLDGQDPASADENSPRAASRQESTTASTPESPRGRSDESDDSGRSSAGSRQGGGQQRSQQQGRENQQGGNRQGGNQQQGEGGGSSRRRRRRRKNRGGQDGPQGDDVEQVEDDGQPQGNEPIEVEGYLDMRDEGYGFLRINGYLPSKQDAYIPVRLARQYGLRKGDHLTGMMRPAGRNEKNPALLTVTAVNGGDPEAAKQRPRFEDLTALFPDQRLSLEDLSDPSNMTARIIDLVSPIGKGQRGIIVSPPKAGKTTVMKTIAKMIEKNHPDVQLIVLLIDERPEEVTDMRRNVAAEVISSTFDRPSDEHTHVAEMTIAKAKRAVEEGKDVVVILDGITRLSRAYNLAAPASGRILSGGIDAGALYPPKKFFGAARNVEEGGSLTILATALVDTNSRMDEAIFEEFKGTGNMELRLDRKISERRIYPAIDVDASMTRHEELLFDRKELQMVWKLRRVLSGLAADGNAAPGLELLIDRLKTFRTNSEFLSEIARQPGM